MPSSPSLIHPDPQSASLPVTVVTSYLDLISVAVTVFYGVELLAHWNIQASLPQQGRTSKKDFVVITTQSLHFTQLTGYAFNTAINQLSVPLRKQQSLVQQVQDFLFLISYFLIQYK